HGAGGGNVHVTANQNRAHSRAGKDWLRLLFRAGRADAHHRRNPCLGKIWRKLFDGRLTEAVEDERSVNRLEILRVAQRLSCALLSRSAGLGGDNRLG